MPAIVRVKRRIDEEPLSSFILNGKKRQRLETESGIDGEVCAGTDIFMNEGLSTTLVAKEDISTILKFAGTIKEQDDAATKQLACLTKEQARELVLQKQCKPTVNCTERSRQEMRQLLHENRFQVVNCMRTTFEENVDEHGEHEVKSIGSDDGDCYPPTSILHEAAAIYNNELTKDGDADSLATSRRIKRVQTKQITIVDIERQQLPLTIATAETVGAANSSALVNDAANNGNEHALERPADSGTSYVYDLYIPENEQQASYADMMDDNYLSIRAFDDLLYQERFNNVTDDEYDSEDSNQENYFANEYPEEMNSVDENSSASGEYEDAREMRRTVEKFVLAEDDDENEHDEMYDTSSDDEQYDQYSDPYVHTVDQNDEAFVDDVDAFVDAECRNDSYARFNVFYKYE